jgi:hypothetical protein
VPTDPFGDLFVNRLNNGTTANPGVSLSDLNEDRYSAGADFMDRYSRVFQRRLERLVFPT